MANVDLNQAEPNVAQDDSERKKSFSDYTKCGILGVGSFGTVLRVKNKKGELFALKCIDLTSESKPDQLKERETKPTFLDHPNIVKCYDFWTEENTFDWMEQNEGIPVYLYILMELCKHTLEDWIGKCSLFNRKREYRSIFNELLNGVQYLHLHRLIHRDIKPENIYCGFDGKYKIADFSTVLNLRTTKNPNELEHEITPQKHTTAVGTLGFMAPEVMSGYYDHTVDIYSLGVILLLMVTPKQTSEERHMLIANLLQANFPECSDGKFEVEFNLFKRMLSDDPEDRPTIVEIKETQLSASINDDAELFEEFNKRLNILLASRIMHAGVGLFLVPIWPMILPLVYSFDGSLFRSLEDDRKKALSEMTIPKVKYSDI